MTTGDPLELLRRYNTEGKLGLVRIKDTRVEFEGGKHAFDRKTKSAYRSNKGRGEPYDLDALYIFLRNINLPRKEYMGIASQYGVRHVSVLDKKDLTQYLSGQVETVPAIQAQLVAPDKIEDVQPMAIDKASIEAVQIEKNKQDGKQDGKDQYLTSRIPEVEVPKDPDQLLGLIRGVERNLQDHTSIMMCPVQQFSLFIDPADRSINEFKKTERQRAGESENNTNANKHNQNKQEAAPTVKKQQPSATTITTVTRGSAGGTTNNNTVEVSARTGVASTRAVRYNQFEQAQYSKNRFGEADLGINEYGNAQPQQQGPTRTQNAVGEDAELSMEELEKQERLKAKERERQQRKQKGREQLKMKEAKRQKLQQQQERSSSKVAAGRPIILLPKGFGCILNKYNAKEFLEKGTYKTWEEAQKKMSNQKPKPVQNLNRTFLRPGVPYKITDQLPEREKDWERVCAVVITGKKWQFKDYPFAGVKEGNLADLFTNICGIYFHYGSDPIPRDVEQWNVKAIAIDKNNRHKDIAAFRDFWSKLDSFLSKKQFPYKF
jgi:parafibromin